MKDLNIERIPSILELYQKVQRTIEDPSKYMSDDPDGWSITSIVSSTSRANSAAMNVLSRRNMDGGILPDGQSKPMKPIKLKVLTRQACSADKDGKILNHARKLLAHEEDEAKAGSFPRVETLPVAGDFVLVQGDMREINEVGVRMTPDVAFDFERRHQHEKYKWKNGLKNFYKDYAVDEDGCILVEPIDAVQLLKFYGEEVVFPKFRKEDLALESGMKARRVITNWMYREVPADYKEPKETAPQQQQNTQNQNQNSGRKN